MSLVVTQRPSIASPATSKWNAVGNPILYKFTRKDYNITAVADSAGALQITVNTNLTTLSTALGGPVVVGATMWVSTDNGVYNALYTVVSVTNAASSVVTFSAGTYTAAATTGYINLSQRLNYKVSIGVYANAFGGTSSLIGTLLTSPKSNGDAIIDIRRVLWSDMSPDNDAIITGVSGVSDDLNSVREFYIKYTEIWIGSAESETSDSANEFYSVYGANQIIAPYGGNLIEYAIGPYDTYVDDTTFTTGWVNGSAGDVTWGLGVNLVAITNAGQTTTRVRREVELPMYTVYTLAIGYNATSPGAGTNALSYALSNGQTGAIGTAVVSAGATLTTTFRTTSEVTFIEIYGLGAVSQLTLNIIDVDLTTSNIPYFLTKLEKPVMWRDWPFLLSIIVRETIGGTPYLSDGVTNYSSANVGTLTHYDLNTELTDQTPDSYDLGLYEAGNLISQIITVELRDVCDNPILLIGRNTLGGALEWMFDVSQEYTYTYDDGSKRKRLVLTAENLTLNQWEALEDFNGLGEVYRNPTQELTSSTIKTHSVIGQQVYAVDQDGSKVGVIVIPTENTTNTRQERHVFTLEIEYPEVFTA